MKNYQVCKRCIMDTTVPNIRFDENGECDYCKLHDKMEEMYPLDNTSIKQLGKIVNTVKEKGRNRKYDCVVGLSGGTDSTYCLYLAKKWGLRPLAVHLDNGWNSETAITNIKKTVTKLNVPLKVVKADWEEFRDLQIAFLKASVPDAEIPTDIGIYSTLYRVADKERIRYIINGHSFRAEGTAPIGWTYMDGKYIESVYRRFGKKEKLRSYSNLKILNLLYYMLKGIKEFRPLEYIDYNKEKVRRVLKKELDWKYYGGLHYESIYTRLIAAYLFRKKFNIDYRKVSLSASIRSGHITRSDALKKIKETPYPEDKIKKDKEYVIKKLGLSNKEFDEIIARPSRSFLDYSTYYSTIKSLRVPIKLACTLKLLPWIFYEKYALDNV